MTDDELNEKKGRVRRRWGELDPEGKFVDWLDVELKSHEGNPEAQQSILKGASIGGVEMQSDIFRVTGQAVHGGGPRGAASTNKKFTDRHPAFQ